jgi:hypothetical protein
MDGYLSVEFPHVCAGPADCDLGSAVTNALEYSSVEVAGGLSD